MSFSNKELFVNGFLFEDEYGIVRFVFVIYLCVVGVCGIIVNCLVIFVFWKYLKFRIVVNLFILNLVFCDVMFFILDNIFLIVFMLYERWLFGCVGCVVYGFFYYFFICCIVLMLVVIFVD